MASSLVVTPVEHLRIRMQIEGTKEVKRYSGSIDAGIKIFKQHGFAAVQKGWVATMWRDGPFFAFYFMLYEEVAKILKGGSDDPITPLQGFLAGGTTGVLSWVLTFPTDTLKSIAQTEELDAGKRLYKGYFDMVRTIIKTEGIKKLYNGLLVVTLRGFPVNAVTFLCYEIARSEINGLRSK